MALQEMTLPPVPMKNVARGFVDKNNNFVISGITDGAGHGGTDIFVVKINSSTGSIKWQYAYGDTSDDALWNFIEGENGNSYYLPGNTVFPGTTEGDLWVVKIDTSGNIIWQKTFGITGKWDEALNASLSHDGILLGSYFETDSVNWSASVIKVDSSGNFRWARVYKIGDLDWTNDLKELNDSSIIIAGVTTDTVTWGEDYLFIRTNSSGDVPNCNYITSFTPYITTTNTSKLPINFTVTQTNATHLSISSTETDVSPTISTICYTTFITERKFNPKNRKILISPNLLNEHFYIITNLSLKNMSIKIYDVSLREISTIKLKNGENRVNVSYLEPGIYYIKIKNKRGKEILNTKIIKIK